MQRILRWVRRGDMLICTEVSGLGYRPNWHRFFAAVTRGADPGPVLIFPLLLVAGGGAGMRYGWILLLALMVNSLLTTVLKGLGGRPRPKKILYNRDSRPGFYNEYAFPSGHTAAACTVATCYGAVFPSAALAWWLLAAVVGVSRIYLEEHYVSDVVAGAVLGTGGTLLAILLLAS